TRTKTGRNMRRPPRPLMRGSFFLLWPRESYRGWSVLRIWQTKVKFFPFSTTHTIAAYFLLDELLSPIWEVPFGRIPGFVGRADELERLKRQIFDPNSRRIVSILGLGGIGKSRLALELANHMNSEHPQCSIFWIDAVE